MLEAGAGVETLAEYHLSEEEKKAQVGASMLHHPLVVLLCNVVTLCMLHVAVSSSCSCLTHTLMRVLLALSCHQGRDKVAVAVRSGVLLATAFHPELTTDIRWYEVRT